MGEDLSPLPLRLAQEKGQFHPSNVLQTHQNTLLNHG